MVTLYFSGKTMEIRTILSENITSQLNQDKILVTCGSGLLGKSIRKLLPNALYPESKYFDVTDFNQMREYLKNKKLQCVLHLAAFTSPPKVDANPARALKTNIIGTANITLLCIKYAIKLGYLSTDYVFKGDSGFYSEEDPVFPVNLYAWSKLGGECAVRLYKNSLIIRTSFGSNTFPYAQAFFDQYTSRQKVDTIARKIILLLRCNLTGTIHIGGRRKSVYSYAKSLNRDEPIKRISRRDVSFVLPKDTSLNTEKYNTFLKKHRI